MARRERPTVPTEDELVQAHAALEQRLEALGKLTWLSPREELEVRELKKRKLALKDDLARLRATQ